MKKLIAIFLLLALMLTACSDSGPTSYDDHFNHQTPEDKQQHEKLLLERDDYAEHIESILNVMAYPDLLILDSTGYEVVGMYIYDPETGLATGWTDLETGEKTMYEAGKEVDLGKPDPNKMVDFKGSVKLGFAVYEKDNKATGAELYFFLSDAEDAPLLQSFLLDFHGETLTAESETVYKILKDEAAVEADFAKEEKAGSAFFSKNADDYVSVLKINYGVAEPWGE